MKLYTLHLYPADVEILIAAAKAEGLELTMRPGPVELYHSDLMDLIDWLDWHCQDIDDDERLREWLRLSCRLTAVRDRGRAVEVAEAEEVPEGCLF